MKRIFIWILIAAAASVVLWGGLKGSGGAASAVTARLFGAPIDFIRGLLSSGELARDAARLALEAESLRAELRARALRGGASEEGGRRTYRAKIYSDYPLNNRAAVIIAAGSAAGIRPSLPVTVGGDFVFFGQVVEARERMSVVRTVADPGWEMPVRIGETEADALLTGGREPRLTLIAKDAKIASGEAVYTAGRDVPYGLTVGTVANIRVDPTAAFYEADLVLPYRFSDLRDVSILFE